MATNSLVDPLFAYKNRYLPRIVDFPGPLSEGVVSIVLNHATAIAQTGGMTVIARSSVASFLDTQGTGKRDYRATGGPFPVAAVGRAGSGYVVLISNPSILMNGMLHIGQNARFLQNVFALGGLDARVYLDTAHVPHAPLDIAKGRLTRAREFLRTVPIAFATTAIAVAVPLAKRATLYRR